jgi:hypothetical protein
VAAEFPTQHNRTFPASCMAGSGRRTSCARPLQVLAGESVGWQGVRQHLGFCLPAGGQRAQRGPGGDRGRGAAQRGDLQRPGVQAVLHHIQGMPWLLHVPLGWLQDLLSACPMRRSAQHAAHAAVCFEFGRPRS